MVVCPLNILSFCAGVGGLELGIRIAEPGARGILYVEREAAAAASLVASMEAGWLHPAPVWSDAGTIDARPWRGFVHCVASGDPCQPNSVAGKGLGADDDRWLIDQFLRVIDECRPYRLFRENVPGNADGQLAALVPALERMGYRVASGIFSAAEVGASHRRERLFIMADADVSGRWAEGHGGLHAGPAEKSGGAMANASHGQLPQPRGRPEGRDGDRPTGAGFHQGRPLDDAVRGRHGDASRALCARRDGAINASLPAFAPGPSDPRWPDILARAPELEPAVRRMADGLAYRTERLRACGNGVFPLAAANAWVSLSARLEQDRRARAGAAAVIGEAA